MSLPALSLFLRCGRNSEPLEKLARYQPFSSLPPLGASNHTRTQRQTGCIVYAFQLCSDVFFYLSGAERRGSGIILGLRALASIADSAACIILARCPDYGSAASLAPLDGDSSRIASLVFYVCFLAGIRYQSEVWGH